ncbi:MAG: O-antigen ligase family protein [Chloroflexi bacterium]|nr:O-antigen ligase family protein [Chloroflexota bacterium]
MQASGGMRAASAVGVCLGAATLVITALPSPMLQLGLLGLVCPLVAVLSGNLRRVLLAAVLLDTPLLLGTHLGYRPDLADFGGLVGWDISVTTLALAGLYALWAMNLLGRVGATHRPAWRASLPGAAYLACVAVSMLVAEDVTAASFQLALIAQMFLLYLYMVSVVRTREDIVFLVTVLVTALAGEALLMVAQGLGGSSFSIPSITGRVPLSTLTQGQASRIGGTIGSANAAAIYLSLLLAPAISVLLTPLGRWRKRLALLAIVLGAGALILTLARGGWVAFAISVAIMCLLAHRRGWLPITAPVALIGLVLLVGLVFRTTIETRLVAYDEGSAASRIPLMQLALRIIEEHPLLGVGANNYVLAMQRYATPNFSDYGGDWLYLVHNHYLLVWAETGFIGLVAFLWFLAATLRAGWRAWQTNDRLVGALALGFTAAMVGHLVYMNVDLFNDRAQTQTLWVCAALLVCISRVEVRSERAAVSEHALTGQGRASRARPARLVLLG